MRNSTKCLILMSLGLLPLASALLLLPVREINVGYGVALTIFIEVLLGLVYNQMVKSETHGGETAAVGGSRLRQRDRSQTRELELQAALEACFPDALAIRDGQYDWQLIDKQTGVISAKYTGRQVLELLDLL